MTRRAMLARVPIKTRTVPFGGRWDPRSAGDAAVLVALRLELAVPGVGGIHDPTWITRVLLDLSCPFVQRWDQRSASSLVLL